MKKIYLLIITVLCCVILFMNVDFNVYAVGTDDCDDVYSEAVELTKE